MVQVYTIMHDIDKLIKTIFFTMHTYGATHGHSVKLFKRSRLLVRPNSFSHRVVDNLNSLTEDIVNAPSLNAEPTIPVLYSDDTQTSSAHLAVHPDNNQEKSESITRMHQKRPTGPFRCRHRYIKVCIKI